MQVRGTDISEKNRILQDRNGLSMMKFYESDVGPVRMMLARSAKLLALAARENFLLHDNSDSRSALASPNSIIVIVVYPLCEL